MQPRRDVGRQRTLLSDGLPTPTNVTPPSNILTHAYVSSPLVTGGHSAARPLVDV